MFLRNSSMSIFFTVTLIFIITMLIACAPVEYEVTTDVDPAGAGDITGSGKYQEGEDVGLTAEPGEQYQLVYDIYRKDDGTFRVGDYAIKDLKTGEVLEEVSISMF